MSRPSFDSTQSGFDSAQSGFDSAANTANTIATGVIVAIVVCSVLALASLGFLIWWYRRHTKRRREREAALDASLYGPPGSKAAQPTTYPPRSPSLGRAAPEMAATPAAGAHAHYQQQNPQHTGVSSTSASTAVESDGRPRYEMGGAASPPPPPPPPAAAVAAGQGHAPRFEMDGSGVGPATGTTSHPPRGDQYV